MREVVEEHDSHRARDAVKRARQVVAHAVRRFRGYQHGRTGRQADHGVSPKGGVGKTTLAVNLGVALAAKDQRKVCLVDLDLGSATWRSRCSCSCPDDR